MISPGDVRHVYGADVYSTDGDKIGSAGQVYLDNDTGAPAWVAVRTGLFGKKESFVPLQDATLDGDRLEVPYAKDRVKHAPRIDQDGQLSPADEDELYRYYSPDDQRAGAATAPAAEDRHDTGDDAVTRSQQRHDTGGDDAMTRSEERLVAGTRTEQVGKARLRKYVVTEEQQVTVPVTREEVRVEEDRDTPAPAGRDSSDRSATGHEALGHEATGHDAARDSAPRDGDPEMVLWEERPVVTTERVPVEKVRLRKETVTGDETVTGEVRKERIELEEDGGRGPGRSSRG